MIVDSSAMLAIFFDEPEAGDFLDQIGDAWRPRIPAPNWVEVSILLESRGDAHIQAVAEQYMERGHLVIAPFLVTHAQAARVAWRQFGRGRHPARLNFGDCMAYGFAKFEDEPLLFKGEDFSRTDIVPALKR